MKTSDTELREVTANELQDTDGGRSDIGQKLQITLNEANSIYNRAAAQPAAPTVLVHEPKHQ